ncbi:unnamed protein product [Parajaminaea phylloscopi]
MAATEQRAPLPPLGSAPPPASVPTGVRGHAKKASVASYETTSSFHSMARRPSIPHDRIRLELLLITGQRAHFDLVPEATIADVKDQLWRAWPASWPAQPASESSLRILHLGHILPDSTPLGADPPSTASTSLLLSRKTSSQSAPIVARNLRAGTITVMHVLIKGGQSEQADAKASSAEAEASRDKKASVSAERPQVEDQDVGSGSCRCVIC